MRRIITALERIPYLHQLCRYVPWQVPQLGLPEGHSLAAGPVCRALVVQNASLLRGCPPVWQRQAADPPLVAPLGQWVMVTTHGDDDICVCRVVQLWWCTALPANGCANAVKGMAGTHGMDHHMMHHHSGSTWRVEL